MSDHRGRTRTDIDGRLDATRRRRQRADTCGVQYLTLWLPRQSLFIALVAAVVLSGGVVASPRSRVHASTTPQDSGASLFRRSWSAVEGLGPEFNARSCAACHTEHNEETFAHVSRSITDPAGGHVFARFRVNASGAVEQQAIPTGASLRRAPALEGLGLLERVAGSDIARSADPDDEDRDGISGRMPSGRFGWKGRMPDLTTAVAAAFVNELGLSSPYFTERNGDNPQHPDLTREQVESVADYVRALAAPRARRADRDRRAAAVFERIGCAKCHRPTFQVHDRNGQISVNGYTDLLLHDMGPALADGIAEGNASGQEFRTAPLWGLSRHRGPYLHDGRAKTLEDAILMHGGEAASAVAAYVRLPSDERRQLRRFLGGV